MLKRLLILLLFFPRVLYAQFSDNFESGTIVNWKESTEGRWAASDINTISETYSLHHIFDNPEAGHDQISISFPKIDLKADTTVWRFKIKHAYNPSSANNWGVFLLSDESANQMYPSGNINGYVLGVNYSGSDDILKLWKVSKGNSTEVFSTSINWQVDVGITSSAAIEIKRDQIGNWKIYFSVEGNFDNIIEIGNGFDNEYLFADKFGVYYEYSSSQDQKIWIDDINIVGEIYNDTIKPQIDSLIIISSKVLKVYFNEDIDSISAVNPMNYIINGGIGNPDSLSLDSTKKSVELFLIHSLLNKTYYNISVHNITDIAGNLMEKKSIEFLCFMPETYDVIINEIMCDPEPTMFLPAFEYIELYNNSDFEIDLKDWQLTVGSTSRSLSSKIINSGEYLILCNSEAESKFIRYGDVLKVSGFPSLSNNEQTIVLRNQQKEFISQVSYSKDWYKDDYKAEGGWSLEQIDPLNPCGTDNNWIASNSETGGTPGQENSVFASNPDIEEPELLRIGFLDDKHILLFFSETLDSLSAMYLNNYMVDHSIGNPSSVDLIGSNYKSLVLEFEKSFSSNTIYTLEIPGGLFDCAGNEINNMNSGKFSIPELVKENDLVINEVLFNPFAGGFDFVEIYNRSEKIIDLKDVLIAAYDDEKLDFSSIESIISQSYLFFPSEYIVLTENPESVQGQYITKNEKGFIKVADLPGFNDDKGRVMLLDKWQNRIDNFAYSDDMHFTLLATSEGVSLERINFERPTNDKSNWHSASELVSFASPAYENSQFLELTDIDEEVSITPETFSPDNDGFDDFTNIYLKFNEAGYVANIKIFDSNGRLIRYLANNKLLGVDGVIVWDGLDEKNQKVPVGIYVIFIEVYDLKGKVKQFKKSVIVATKW